MKKIIFYNIFLFIIFYSFLEILTGNLLYRNKLDCAYLMCNKKIIYNNPWGFYDKTKIIYERDKNGFRGKKNNLKNINILTVGGSTTDERFLKIEDSWSKKLEKKFSEIDKNFKIINAGMDGQSTVGHIWNFEQWFNKLENFKPRYIIFYIGLNEQLSNLNRSSKYDNEYNLNNYSYLNVIRHHLWQNHGITYKLYDLVYKKLFKNSDIIHGHKSKNRNFVLVKDEFSLNNIQKKYLINNLNKLTQLTYELNAIPIFITQKTIEWHIKDNLLYSVSSFDQRGYEQQISEVIIEFCKNNNIKYIDINKNLNFDKSDTYDLMHTTPVGSEKIANFIFNNLKKELQEN